jgi:hypothetical protein
VEFHVTGSADGGEEATGRKTGTGASPPIQRLGCVFPRPRIARLGRSDSYGGTLDVLAFDPAAR